LAQLRIRFRVIIDFALACCLSRSWLDGLNDRIFVLLSQNTDLLEKARAARMYKDELDVFREKV